MRISSRSFWGKFKRWDKIHHVKIVSLIVAGLVLATVIAVAAIFYTHPEPAVVTYKKPIPAKPTPPPVKYYSPLTGLEVPDKATTELPVTGVMIENSPDARPQSGLKDGGIIYEAIAEGGITRFLVLYQEKVPALIGPVRSLRLYDIDWFAPYQASIAHVGGSYNALKQVRNGAYRDIDQFFNGSYYWRSTDRYAPHNVYTSNKRLSALNKARGYNSSVFTAWPRKDDAPTAKITATDITTKLSSVTYNGFYKYNAKTNSYTRYQANAVHKDREGGAITPKVVIAMKVNESTVMEDGYRQKIQTSGSGKAYIFQDGTEQTVTWSKKNSGANLVFTDSDGKEIALNRGQVWIAAVPNGYGGVSWTPAK